MTTNNHKLIPWKEYRTGGAAYRIRAKYGFTHSQGQDPYWSVTGEIERKAGNGRWVEGSCGCLHKEVSKHFQELAPTIRWHLCATLSGPMHYEANGLYWWEHYIGARVMDKQNIRDHANGHDAAEAYFKSTTIFGALPDDAMPPVTASNGEVREWMRNRLPRLMEAFRADINKLDPSLWSAQ